MSKPKLFAVSVVVAAFLASMLFAQSTAPDKPITIEALFVWKAKCDKAVHDETNPIAKRELKTKLDDEAKALAGKQMEGRAVLESMNELVVSGKVVGVFVTLAGVAPSRADGNVKDKDDPLLAKLQIGSIVHYKAKVHEKFPTVTLQDIELTVDKAKK